MYTLLQKLLFSLPPERAHDLTLKTLNACAQSKATRWVLPTPLTAPRKVMGLTFANPVGLAAGLDKNATYLPGLSALGFGFLEVGTATPLAQPGNPCPRLFRLAKDHALINRMGFNNEGIAALIHHVKQSAYKGILGINLGKNKATPEQEAIADYVNAMQQCYTIADYITINISSPNTPGLRKLQASDQLARLLEALKGEQALLEQQHHQYVPLVVKISPDLSQEAIESIATCLLNFEVDGLIATNTTTSRPGLQDHYAEEAGGLSGAPLKTLANQVLAAFAAHLKNKIALIAVGGILSAQDAQEKFELGADLVQIYSGLIYRGPRLINEIVRSTLN